MPTQMHILGIGYCSMDTLCVVPPMLMDQKVRADHMLMQGGGPAATAIVAAARLGCQTSFMGVVGDDAIGRMIRDAFEYEQVQTDCLIQRDHAQSAAAVCLVDQQTGKRSITWHAGTARPIQPDEVNPDWVQRASAIHCDGHQIDAALTTVKFARQNDIPVFLDAGTLVDRIDELIALSDVVFASEEFAQRYTGKKNPQQAIEQLHQQGPGWAGVTLGSGGSLGFDGQQTYHVPSIPVDVVDTTGAGDVYHGALAARYLQTRDQPPSMLDCMRYASVVAAIKCTALGGRTAIPTHQQTLKKLKSIDWTQLEGKA